MKPATLTALKKSFFITLAYVGLGTLTLLLMLSGIEMGAIINDLFVIILAITIPVTSVSFAIIYSNSHASVGTVLLIQSITFLLFWLVAFLWVNRKNKLNSKP